MKYKKLTKDNLESKLKVIAASIGSNFVVFKLKVDAVGNISILGVENDDFDEEDESLDEIEYPTIIPKIDIKKPLTYLGYIG